MADSAITAWQRVIPALAWSRQYNPQALAKDLVAAAIVTIMLIPQSLAYAMLAGLPAEAGLYATILPLIAYALFGTSRTLSVGPVAVISLMTATAIAGISRKNGIDPITAAVALALLSGLMLVVMGLLRFGFLANFLSHPVVAGFITASGIIIAVGQFKHLLGIEAGGDNLVNLGTSLYSGLNAVNMPTLLLGTLALIFLLWARAYLCGLLERVGLSPSLASDISKAGPVIAVLITGLAAWLLHLDTMGVALVGTVPPGLPHLVLPAFTPELWRELAGPALLISIIGYVESVSVGKTLAAKRRQRIDPDQELIGLGAANVASSISGGFPVSGGFSRSVVNFDAGAVTQAASIFTALGIALAALLLTPLLSYLPKATLAAVIIVAVSSLIDFSSLTRSWSYAKSDFIAVATTIGLTLLFGVELGVMCGVGASIGLHLYKSSRPHIAVVGEIPGTEHFRNIQRHDVITHAAIISLRIDESLYFANAAFVEDTIFNEVAENTAAQHVVLMCTAVNEIDLSALEVLEAINERLRQLGITLHLSEVKGPVMDSLKTTEFMNALSGRVFRSQHEAIKEILQVA
jgi:SulP family sulfate permease